MTLLGGSWRCDRRRQSRHRRCQSSELAKVSVLLGNGNGTFQAQRTYATGNAPNSVAIADLTGDGKPDLVVANYHSDTVSVLLGNGNGTFQTQQVFYTGASPLSVAVGDLTGDGRPDLVVAKSSTVSVLLTADNGNFTGQDLRYRQHHCCTVRAIDQPHDASRPSCQCTSVTYTVTFNEPVTGVAAADFQLALGGTIAATLTASNTGKRVAQWRGLHRHHQRHHGPRHARPERRG